jgi:hypothetical protein
MKPKIKEFLGKKNSAVSKKLVLLFLTGTVFATANAQIQFGVKAGANLASLNGSGVTGAKTKLDFNAGILASIKVPGSFSIQPEVIYSGQGAKLTSFNGLEEKVNLGYINVPVLLKYHFPLGLFAETGPQFGFLLSAKSKIGSTSADYKSYVNSTDFSWAFGVGYMIPIVKLGVDARYNLGITDAAKNSSTTGSFKNNIFQVGVFYLFGGK